MPTKDISQSREGRDQRSDSATKDAASSNRIVGDFATRRETCQYAAHNELSQQGVGEQAYEQELARKGKNLAIPDEASWHSDTSSSSGYSSGSDSDASLDANRPEKLVLTDKSGLWGGADGINRWGGMISSDLHNGAAHAASDLTGLAKLGWKMFSKHRQKKKFEKHQKELQAQRAEAERRQKELQAHIADAQKRVEDAFYGRYNELQRDCNWYKNLTFGEYKRAHPDISDRDRPNFEQDKQYCIEECEQEMREMRELGPERWYKLMEYRMRQEENRARDSDQGASTSRG